VTDIAAPSPAERVRSVLAAADSLDVVSPAGRTRLHGAHTVGRDGLVHLDLAAHGELAREAAAGDLDVTLELTDVAPVATRHRVRAHVIVHGRLADGTVHPSCAQVIDESYRFVAAEALAAAEPDPLATREASLLLHLVDTHRDVLDLMTRLIPPPFLLGVDDVCPIRLDRFGIVLRLRRRTTERDVRLRFRSPLTRPDEGPTGLTELLRHAHHRM
jgi:hypothetical protein